MMTAGIFYFSRESGDGRQVVSVKGHDEPVYIRAEAVHCEDLEEALGLAQPADGESVMNTHPLRAEDDEQ